MLQAKTLIIRLVVPVTLAINGSLALGQMGGGGGGGAPGGTAPAFFDPKFSDKLYENGGPQGRETKDGAIILSVTIEGNSSISQNFILSTMQSREDRTFDKETFNRDISTLYRTNLFKKITPYFTEAANGVHIRLIVDERPIIKEVVFRGNQRLEDRQLSKHAGLQKGDPLDPISLNSAKSRLIELYQDKGMNQVDIQIAQGLKPGQREVEFIVNEGPVERLNKIYFVGNQAFSSEILKTKISSRDTRHGLTTWFGNKASDNKMEADRDALMGYYRSLGYFDARVEFRKDYTPNGDFIDLTFIVSEGQRYKVKSVSIVGTKRYQPSELLPYMKLKAGEPFMQPNKLNDEKFLRDVYGAQGHIFAEVIGELIYQPNNEVDVVYNIGEGDVYRISEVRVHIDGDHTKERVVMQPLGKIRPGSIANGPEIDNAERRLKYLNIFNNDPSQGTVPNIRIEPPAGVDRELSSKR
jgi:outer membrane protein insertion porin family